MTGSVTVILDIDCLFSQDNFPDNYDSTGIDSNPKIEKNPKLCNNFENHFMIGN